jgi:hypothetical protein
LGKEARPTLVSPDLRPIFDAFKRFAAQCGEAEKTAIKF